MDRFEGILKVTAVVLYGSMILSSLEVSGSGVRKYYGVAYEEGIRFSQESYMDEGHALEWGMWETGDSGVKEARSKVMSLRTET